MSDEPPPRADLEKAVETLAAILADDGLLIGAFAVAAWGYVRGTDDVDFVTRRPPLPLVKHLRSLGVSCRLRRGDPGEGDPAWVIQGTLGGARFDILPPLVPLNWERPLVIRLSGQTEIKVVDIEGLVRLKLRAHGPQDLMDVAALMLLHADLAAEALKTATAYGVQDLLERWLADPRLKAEVAHQRQLDLADDER